MDATWTRRRLRFSRALDSFLAPSVRAASQYHRWYYGTEVWKRTQWMGVPVQKSPSDMWNYQEIIHDLKPRLVIEFGTYFGGSAMFFSSILQQVNRLPSHVLSVDIDHANVFPAC